VLGDIVMMVPCGFMVFFQDNTQWTPMKFGMHTATALSAKYSK
jgi:hypothetical protein